MAGKTFFLVIEGIDGSGKSSITRKLVRAMEATLGRYVKLTFEPHDPSCAGLFIRQVLMKKITNIPLRTLALAFAANRSDHCDREIQPFLEQVNGKNRVVISDRYYLSSLVYQSSPDFGFEKVMALNASAIKPDLTIFLTASSKTCYERMRRRGDDKELFEVNLNDNRKKYIEAINFLNSRGDNVVTVEAEGTMQEVFYRIKKVISENSPEWLTFQDELPFDDPDTVFYPTDVTVDYAVNNIISTLDINHNSVQLQVDELCNYSKKYVDGLNFEDAANLYFDFLKCNGYQLHGKLPWTDLDAYELSCSLPLGVEQRGAALLLGESQRYDVVITKLLESQRYKSVEQMSDFLFIFDANPSHLHTNYYEREKLVTAPTQQISPALVVIGRAEIADYLSNLIVKQVRTEAIYEN